MNEQDVLERIRRVHDTEGWNMGADTDRTHQNTLWERGVGIVSHGHPHYGPGDRAWRSKQASASRPPTNEAAVHTPDNNFWDFVIGQGGDKIDAGFLNPGQDRRCRCRCCLIFH